jgi:hypothetical protein
LVDAVDLLAVVHQKHPQVGQGRQGQYIVKIELVAPQIKLFHPRHPPDYLGGNPGNAVANKRLELVPLVWA